MAQFYNRMGSRVTVLVGRSDHVATRENDDVTEALHAFLCQDGVEFVFCERAESVAGGDGGLTLKLDGGDPAELNVSHLFVATDRLPNTDDLGLETSRGIIDVDKRLARSVEGVWAAGDIRGGPMFTHTSWDDHRILLSQMAGDGSRTTDRIVPYAIFTDPELGRAGMTEREAREAGNEAEVMTFDMRREKGKARNRGERGPHKGIRRCHRPTHSRRRGPHRRRSRARAYVRRPDERRSHPGLSPERHTHPSDAGRRHPECRLLDRFANRPITNHSTRD
jgi:pyruvate/2-oxoglutarate dehydrogenase complex dihydrolipoamide dehydrogenase (E3) component